MEVESSVYEKKKISFEERRNLTKHFLAEKRANPLQSNALDIWLFEPTVNKVSAPQSKEEFIEVFVGEEQEKVLVKKSVAQFSPWFKRLFNSNVSFKETISNSVVFTNFNPEAFKEVVNYLEMESQFNPNPNHSEPRIIFQFTLVPDLLMEILFIAQFLEILSLVDLCLLMVKDYIEDVPELDKLPLDLIEKVVQNLSPFVLLQIEEREDFKNLNLDLSSKWEQEYKKLWDDDTNLIYQCSWISLDEVNLAYPCNTAIEFMPISSSFVKLSYKKLYLHRMIQEEKFPSDILQKYGSSLEFYKISSFRHSIFENSKDKTSDLIQHIKLFPNLHFLHLEGKYFSLNQSIPFIKSLPPLKTLKLTHMNFRSYGSNLLEFLEILPKTLEEFELSSSNLTSNDVLMIVNWLKQTPSISHLSLVRNNIDNTGFFSLLPVCHNLLTLDLRFNKLFSAFIFPEPNPLFELQFLKKLKWLFLAHNSIFSFMGLYFSYLPPNLHGLDLSRTQMNEAAVIALCEAIIEKKLSIQVLDLSGNELTQAGLDSIAKLITQSSSLKSLSLSQTSVSYNTIDSSIPKALLFTKTLSHLDLSHNNLSDHQAMMLVSCLISTTPNHNTSITLLNLSSCGISETCSVHIQKLIENRKDIKIDFNTISKNRMARRFQVIW